MGDNMKELPNEEHPFQVKMKEWFEVNQEIYSKFKDKTSNIVFWNAAILSSISSLSFPDNESFKTD